MLALLVCNLTFCGSNTFLRDGSCSTSRRFLTLACPPLLALCILLYAKVPSAASANSASSFGKRVVKSCHTVDLLMLKCCAAWRIVALCLTMNLARFIVRWAMWGFMVSTSL